MELATETSVRIESAGLDFWMAAVLREADRARADIVPDVVHDLRVALRRCRSIADGYMTFDPHPAWEQMKDESRRLFRQLGSLRDTQVMREWVRRLARSTDEAAVIMNNHLSNQEIQFKQSALEAVSDFNQRKWTSWIRLLSRRTRYIPVESMAFQHIALERWFDAYELHQHAMRNRSQVAYHRLRIGLKKFRYTVENFLPSRHARWGADLRGLQDLLGEMHDLDVLWRTAVATKALRNAEARLEWRRRISEEIDQRLEQYREKMLGKESLARIWRSELPDPRQIGIAALARLRAWASFRDTDVAHSDLVAKLALHIYDGLDSFALMPESGMDARRILEAAALLHDVGMNEGRKRHHLSSYRMIRRLDPPLGWSSEALRKVALIARFHRGALPRFEQKAFSGIPGEQKKSLIMLCGILRLANAFDALHQRRIRRLELKQTGNILHIAAPGYSENDRLAEKLAEARHLLETACRLPILIE